MKFTIDGMNFLILNEWILHIFGSLYCHMTGRRRYGLSINLIAAYSLGRSIRQGGVCLFDTPNRVVISSWIWRILVSNILPCWKAIWLESHLAFSQQWVAFFYPRTSVAHSSQIRFATCTGNSWVRFFYQWSDSSRSCWRRNQQQRKLWLEPDI